MPVDTDRWSVETYSANHGVPFSIHLLGVSEGLSLQKVLISPHLLSTKTTQSSTNLLSRGSPARMSPPLLPLIPLLDWMVDRVEETGCKTRNHKKTLWGRVPGLGLRSLKRSTLGRHRDLVVTPKISAQPAALPFRALASSFMGDMEKASSKITQNDWKAALSSAVFCYPTPCAPGRT